MFPRKNYLLIDKRLRRYSAPEDFSGFAQRTSRAYTSEESEDDSRQSRVSVIDLSVLFENNSGSDSSLELDTTITSKDEQQPSEASRLHPTGCSFYQCSSQQICEPHGTNFLSRFILKTVMFSQAMAVCVAVINIAMEDIEQTFSVNAQSLPHYFMLSGIWTTQLAKREGARGLGHVIRLSGFRYVFLACLHVEATSLTYTALRHQTFIGSQMMDCVAASLSLIIAYVCLDVKFQQTHMVGFAIAFIGSLGMCTANIRSPELVVDAEDAFWGDFIRFGCGIFICFNTLAEELIVKSIDTVEYLGMIGLFGSIICAAQTLLTDHSKVFPLDKKYWCTLCILWAIQLIFISLGPRVLRDVGTTGLHLSLIAYPFYYELLQYCLSQTTRQLSYAMFISYLLILGGLYIFILKRTSIGRHFFNPVRVTLPRSES